MVANRKKTAANLGSLCIQYNTAPGQLRNEFFSPVTWRSGTNNKVQRRSPACGARDGGGEGTKIVNENRQLAWALAVGGRCISFIDEMDEYY